MKLEKIGVASISANILKANIESANLNFVNRTETTDDLNIICNGLPFSSKGHWVAEEDEDMNLIGYHCSICNSPLEFLKKCNYCPNCGIRMEVEE